jgi:hypothetical protein
LKQQTKRDIEQIYVEIQINVNNFNTFVSKLNYTFIENIIYAPLLGNHSLNINSDPIKEIRVSDRVLSVIKSQTPKGAYNFVNKYEILPLTKARYVLKIKKAVNVQAFISFSSEECLKTEYSEYIGKALTEPKVNEYGRNGVALLLNAGD